MPEDPRRNSFREAGPALAGTSAALILHATPMGRKKFCPHGACFDRAGNIFVTESVEAGRVTELRRLS